MKHLKLFETVAQYESFKNGSDFVLPNVSYCQDVKSVWYNNSFIEPTGSYIAVDLGLPSGRLWADRNVGAASPEDAGLYFQWGDTIGYTAEQVEAGEKAFDFYFSDYFDTTDGGKTFNKYSVDKFTVLQPEDDAATVNMGSEYRMPTQNEFQELIDNCTVTYIDLEGNEVESIEEGNLKGIKFTGSNGNSIFIPAAGACGNSGLANSNSECSLWFSDLNFDEYGGDINYFYADYDGYIDCSLMFSRRTFGFPVRGVCN